MKTHSRIQPSKLQIRLGEFDLSGRLPVPLPENNNNSARALLEENSALTNNIYNVEKITVHQQYEPRSHLHDIAIVRLNRPVEFSPVIQRICLPPPSLPSLEDRTAFVAGQLNLDFNLFELNRSIFNYEKTLFRIVALLN